MILRNRGLPQPRDQVQFVEATAEGGPYFRSLHSGRGVAFGDLDNDGRMDLVISHIGEPVAVLRNVATPASWLGIELATKDHRDFVGARVVVVLRA